MRKISYIEEFMGTAGLDHERLKYMRRRNQAVRAFGGSDIYESLSYFEIDVVAVKLADVLSEKIDRISAAAIVRDQWSVWSRVVAAAESKPGPVFWYIIEYETKRGDRWHLTVGSELDSRSEVNLRALAEDIHTRAGVIAKGYVVVEMQSVLADVRAAAMSAGHDFSAAFLPPYGSPELEAVLQPFDETTPDRAIVVSDKTAAAAADVSRRAGIRARAAVESTLPATEATGRRQ